MKQKEIAKIKKLIMEDVTLSDEEVIKKLVRLGYAAEDAGCECF